VGGYYYVRGKNIAVEFKKTGKEGARLIIA
jgi:hypothetical protein